MMELRGIIHCHSTYSYDAKLSLSELRDLCISRGVHFVCMTEHTDELTADRAAAFVKECEVLSDDRFLFIPGFEVPYKVKEVNDKVREAGLGHGAAREGALGCEHAHILMIGQRTFHEVYAPTIEVLRRWTEEASFVVLAHPVRNHFAVDDGLLTEIDALEVWNQQYEGKRVPRTRSLVLLEELRAEKPGLLATGGVDFHRIEHFGAPLVTLDVHKLTESEILEKLVNGAYIVSSEHSTFFGTLPNTRELIKKHQLESFFSVSIIILGKMVNKMLARFGIKLPKFFKQLIRRRI